MKHPKDISEKIMWGLLSGNIIVVVLILIFLEDIIQAF